MRESTTLHLTRGLAARVAALGEQENLATQGVLLGALLVGLEAIEANTASLPEAASRVRHEQTADDARRKRRAKSGPTSL